MIRVDRYPEEKTMLNDAEHKLFTLLVKGYGVSGPSPTWDSLQSHTKWKKDELIGIINSLEHKGYLTLRNWIKKVMYIL